MKTITRQSKHRPARRTHAPARKRHAAVRPAPKAQLPVEAEVPTDVIEIDTRDEELSDEEALDRLERQHLY